MSLRRLICGKRARHAQREHTVFDLLAQPVELGALTRVRAHPHRVNRDATLAAAREGSHCGEATVVADL